MHLQLNFLHISSNTCNQWTQQLWKQHQQRRTLTGKTTLSCKSAFEGANNLNVHTLVLSPQDHDLQWANTTTCYASTIIASHLNNNKLQLKRVFCRLSSGEEYLSSAACIMHCYTARPLSHYTRNYQGSLSSSSTMPGWRRKSKTWYGSTG